MYGIELVFSLLFVSYGTDGKEVVCCVYDDAEAVSPSRDGTCVVDVVELAVTMHAEDDDDTVVILPLLLLLLLLL